MPRVGGALSARSRSIKGLSLRCQTRRSGEASLEARQPSGLASALDGGRTWWAHFEFTRINIEPTILRKKFEDVREGARVYVRSTLVLGRREVDLQIRGP